MLEFKMPTVEEICDEVALIGSDLFPFRSDDLVVFLPYKLVRKFLKPEVIEAEWEGDRLPLDRKCIIDNMVHYLNFAFEKAYDERGLSAMRSIEHLKAWLFLLGDIEALEFAKLDSNYEPYGLPILEYVKTRYRLTSTGD